MSLVAITGPSSASGDETDLLLVAASREEAERTTERLGKAQGGDAVLAIASEGWQAMARSPSPHW